ncbi:MAG: glycosyltransferase family 4 protein [Nonlabens sp.]
MKLNVLIYSTVSPFENRSHGGAETSLKLLGESLSKIGVNVVYVTASSKRRFNTLSYSQKDKLKVVTLHNSILPLTNFHKIRCLIKKINDRIFDKNVRKIIANHQITTVYTYYELDACQHFIKLKAELGFKYVVRIAGMRWANQIQNNPDLKVNFENIFNYADGLNFISEGLVKIFNKEVFRLNMNVIPKQSLVMDIGVRSDLLRNKHCEHSDTNGNIFNLLMASRLSSQQKRQDILVKAISILPKNFSCKLYLVGDGPERNSIKKLIQDLSIENKVELIPFMPQEDLWGLMKETDLLCHSCDYEGLSKVIIESMGMGLPVLASNVLPLNMYIIDGKNSYLVDNDPRKWADKIYQLYSNKDHLTEVGTNAKEFVNNQFNAKKNVHKYVDFFQNL